MLQSKTHEPLSFNCLLIFTEKFVCFGVKLSCDIQFKCLSCFISIKCVGRWQKTTAAIATKMCEDFLRNLFIYTVGTFVCRNENWRLQWKLCPEMNLWGWTFRSEDFLDSLNCYLNCKIWLKGQITSTHVVRLTKSVQPTFKIWSKTKFSNLKWVAWSSNWAQEGNTGSRTN